MSTLLAPTEDELRAERLRWYAEAGIGSDRLPVPARKDARGMHTLYTYGYGGGGSVEDLQAHVAAGALVLDIRCTPQSRRPEFGRGPLLDALRLGGMPDRHAGYQHCLPLGNVNYRRGGPIELVDEARGLLHLERRLRCGPVVLLCGCASWETCHRRMVADLARARCSGLQVRHLAPGERLDGGPVEAVRRTVPALSLLQPWASLIASGAKTVETRSWPTPYRGPLAIHASARWDRDALDLCQQQPFARALRDAGFATPRDLPLGAVVAVATLTQCVYTSDPQQPMGYPPDWVERLSELELAFGDFSPGRYGWLLEDVRALPEPVPAKGALGIWQWSVPEGLVLP